MRSRATPCFASFPGRSRDPNGTPIRTATGPQTRKDSYDGSSSCPGPALPQIKPLDPCAHAVASAFNPSGLVCRCGGDGLPGQRFLVRGIFLRARRAAASDDTGATTRLPRALFRAPESRSASRDRRLTELPVVPLDHGCRRMSETNRHQDRIRAWSASVARPGGGSFSLHSGSIAMPGPMTVGGPPARGLATARSRRVHLPSVQGTERRLTVASGSGE